MKIKKRKKNLRTEFAFKLPFKCRFCAVTEPHGHSLNYIIGTMLPKPNLSSCYHEPETTCEHCGFPVDSYGNTEQDFRNCCFPDCGCDGARLCIAGEANENAQRCNVEGMYQRKDLTARKAKMGLVGLRMDRERKKP